MADVLGDIAGGIVGGIARGVGALAHGISSVAGLIPNAAPNIDALSFSFRATDALLRATAPSPANLRLMCDICYYSNLYYDYPYHSSYRPTTLKDKIQPFQNVKIMSGKDLQDEYEKNQALIIKFKNELINMIPRLQDPSNKPSKELLDEFDQKFLVVQGLTKRNQIIVDHCQKMHNNLGYRTEVEKNPKVMGIDARKARTRLLSENERHYTAIIALKAKEDPKLSQDLAKLSQVKQKLDTLEHNSEFTSRMQNLAQPLGSEHASTLPGSPATGVTQEPKSDEALEDPAKKGVFSQFKADMTTVKTMSTQLKIDEIVAKKFLDEIADSGVKTTVSEGILEMSSTDAKKLCEVAKTLVTKYKNDTVFDLESSSAKSAFRILQESSGNIKISSVTYIEKGKTIVLETDEDIKKFIEKQQKKMQASPILPPSPPETPKPN